jgi:hypothetical protein
MALLLPAVKACTSRIMLCIPYCERPLPRRYGVAAATQPTQLEKACTHAERVRE